MNHLFGISGIVWTQMTADLFTVIFSYVLYFRIKNTIYGIKLPDSERSGR